MNDFATKIKMCSVFSNTYKHTHKHSVNHHKLDNNVIWPDRKQQQQSYGQHYYISNKNIAMLLFILQTCRKKHFFFIYLFGMKLKCIEWYGKFSKGLFFVYCYVPTEGRQMKLYEIKILFIYCWNDIWMLKKMNRCTSCMYDEKN